MSNAMAYEHIQELLKERNETQADLAKLLKRTAAVVTNLFNGSRSLQTEEVDILSRYFSRTPHYILYGREESPRNGLTDAEIALTDAIKTVFQALIENGLATSGSLDNALSFQLGRYKQKNLPNAVEVMDQLRKYVTGELKEPESDIIRRLLQSPPKEEK